MIGARIRLKRKESGYTLEEVAAKLGVSKQTVQRYETGVISNIPSDKIELLSELFNVSPAYIMGWDEREHSDNMIDSYYDTAAEMLELLEETGYSYEEVDKFDQIVINKGTFNQTFNHNDLIAEYINLKKPETIIETLLGLSANSNQKIIESYEKLSDDGKTLISKTINNILYYESKNTIVEEDLRTYTTHPVYLLPASAGTGQFLDGENFEMVTFPTKEIPTGSNFGVRVSGNSMEPQLHDGDVAFIQRSKEIQSGNIGVFILNGDAYIKKMVCDMDECYLVSLNPEYEPIKINKNDDLRTVGKVLWVD